MSDPTPPSSSTPGLLGGRYQLGDRIGGGRLADVFHGTDTQGGHSVAIKVLNADFIDDRAFAERFVRDAQLFADEQQAADPAERANLVDILEAGIDGDTYWVVMELVSGATLAFHERQNPGPMDPARSVDIASAVCNALSFAHAHGVIHRDVTSHNILIGVAEDGTETIKLMDAGIARPTSATNAAQTAAALGTATYVSPEIARGGEPFARSDLYSLSVVLYEMLTGRPPFRGDSPVAIAMAHVRETPKKVSEYAPGIGSKLEAVVMKGLAKNPADRYASADELKADLSQARPSATATAAAGTAAAAAGTEVTSGDAPAVAAAPDSNSLAEADTMVFTSPSASRETRAVNARTLIGIAVAIGVILAVVFVLVSRTSLVEVPNLVGQRSAIAQTALQEAGLSVVIIERASSVDEPGIVLAQAPPPGQKVTTDASVTLTVSKSVGVIEVPSLVGMTQVDAESSLTSLGLTVGLVNSVSSELPAGQVLEQDPPAGTQLGLGGEVNFSVAAGNESAGGVPNLSCMALNNAGNQLQSVGLQMTVVGQEVNPTCQPGARVARQMPLPGSDPPVDGIVQVWSTELPSPSPTPSPTPSAAPTP